MLHRKVLRRVPLSDAEQESWMRDAGLNIPSWVSGSPHVREGIGFCTAIISDFVSRLSATSTMVCHKAKLSRVAFTEQPFLRKLDKPTCGGPDRVEGYYALNLGFTTSQEPFYIRVAVDSRQAS